jgi:hypothetical protein
MLITCSSRDADREGAGTKSCISAVSVFSHAFPIAESPEECIGGLSHVLLVAKAIPKTLGC